MEPWRAKLAQGDTGAAWDLFIERYRRLILATIRRMIDDREDAFDAFGYVCQALYARDLARLRRYREGQARFSTWLVTVVHNQVIDWVRQREGRPRVTAPAALSRIQERIFTHVFVEQRSHVEAYELVRAATSDDLSFSAFLKELAQTYRLVERARPRGVMQYLAAPSPLDDPTGPSPEKRLDAAEIRGRLAEALDSLCDDERVVLQLYVVEGLSAVDVARTLGWPNAKAVYNRAYRGLSRLRSSFKRQGIGPADL